MTTTAVKTYTAKETTKLRAEARAFANLVPVMKEKAFRIAQIAQSCYTNRLSNTAKKVAYTEQHFWAASKKVQAWLNAYPDNTPGYRTANKAYRELVAIAKEVHASTASVEGCLRSYTPLDRLRVHTKPANWDAWSVIRADGLDRKDAETLRYISRNCVWVGIVDYHIYYIDQQTIGVKVYNSKSTRTRVFAIPVEHKLSLYRLTEVSRKDCWFGDAKDYYSENRYNYYCIPKLSNVQ